MRALGFLGPRVSFEHGVWLTARRYRDPARFRHDRGPQPHLEHEAGQRDLPRATAACTSVNVALGTDGMSSNDGNDMFAVLKVAGPAPQALGHRLRALARSAEAWRMATAGGAQAAGDVGGLGRIEVGRRADLVLLDLDSRGVHAAGAPLHQLCSGRPRRPSFDYDRWALGAARQAGDHDRRARDPRRDPRDGQVRSEPPRRRLRDR